jgi:hypothetical protein
MASISCVAKGRIPNCPFNPSLWPLGLLSNLLMVFTELFWLMLDALQLFYTFSPLLAYSIFCPQGKFFMAGRVGEKPVLLLSFQCLLSK